MRVCPKCKSTYASKTQFCGIDGSRLVSRDDDPLIGEVLGKYRVEERVGRGATGCVYRAEHIELGSEFAIKVLLGELGADEEVVGRFRREAKAAGSIRSANVVSVVDVGATPAGLVYLVMEYAHGRPLNRLIKAEAPIDPLRAAKITRDIAAGLAVAHAKGFVHRDVKPANVFVVDEGGREVAKVLDFGIVRLNHSEEATKLTQNGQILGTPSYMAPEQWRESEVGPGADLYALGVLLYEMLGGKKPFVSPSMMALMNKHVTETPVRLPDLGGLDALAMRLLAKTPEERPQSAQEVINMCEELVAIQSMGRGVSSIVPPAHLMPSPMNMREPEPPPADDTSPSASTSSSSVTGSPPPPLPEQGTEAAMAATMNSRVSETGDLSLASLTRRGRSPWAMVRLAMVILAAGIVGISALKVTAREGVAANPPATAIVEQASLLDLERKLVAALSARGLAESDLDGLPAISRSLHAWRQAKTSGDSAQTNAAAEALVKAIKVAKIPGKVLRNKLDRLDTKLAAKVEQISPAERAELEQRYLHLYKRVGDATTPAAGEALAKDIAAFTSEL